MYIREIEIDNFKSFANRTTIPFLGGFTTISGPNGSGKSNIIDSILFALGLSSSRTLRAEKLPDLINNHGKRNEASVRISFGNLPDDRTITVTRKIRRNSTGYTGTYYLNDRVSTLTEIHEELARYNISPGCYNVMMQGDVTGIINMTPFERRKILDEIAGVADFDRRIEQATKELETVDERVNNSVLILSEIDKRLEQLKEEREVALKYQKLREEKLLLESKLSIVKYFELKNSTERLHENMLDSNKAQKEEQHKIKELNAEIDQTAQKLKEITELVKIKGEDQQIEIQKQIEILKGLVSRNHDAVAYLSQQIQDNEKGQISSKGNIERLKEKIEDTLLKIENRQDQITIFEQNIKTEKEELNRILNEISSINKTSNEHLEKRNNLRKELENLKDKENSVLKEKISAEEKVFRFNRDIEEAQKKIDRFEEFKSANIQKKEDLEVQTEELAKELKDYEIVQKNCLYDLDKVKQEIGDVGYDISSAVRKISQLEASKMAAEDFSFDRAVKTVMEAKLEGVHAPLAQLGQVDKEYSTALEIAMGGRMASIVVDNDEVGRIAIEILKSSGAGRSTFLPLNKIRPMPKGMKAPNIDGVIDYAINLIGFDGTYDSAFYYALGETLIVEDINVARRLMGKFRMVTLDGSLVEKTGAMTGGSIRRSGYKFAQANDEELEKFNKRLRELENRENELKSKRAEIERKIEKTRQEYSEALNELHRKNLEHQNIVKMLTEYESEFAVCKSTIEETSPKLEEAQNALSELTLKLQGFEVSIQRLTREIESIEKIIPKDELSKLNEKTGDIEFEIKSFESKLANARNEINGFNMEIDLHKTSIEAQEQNIKESTERVVSLGAQIEQHKVEIGSTIEKITALDAQMKEIGSELIGLQKERDEIALNLNAFERKKVGHENRIEKLKEQVEAYKSRRKELEDQLLEIRDQLISRGLSIAGLQEEKISVDEVNRTISSLQRKMENLEPVNMKALSEYDEVQARSEELKLKIDTLSNEKEQILERMNSYEDLKFKSFMETFDNINDNFKDIFARLSDGIGSLVLEKPETPFVGGLTIEAQPRAKKMQRLESMSGGEKSLTALAFVFALQRFMPAPFYAFDEVDMHLDGINAEKLAQMVKYQAERTQFIVVSLRKPMIEAADRTIGVTQKNSGITKVTGVKLYSRDEVGNDN